MARSSQTKEENRDYTFVSSGSEDERVSPDLGEDEFIMPQAAQHSEALSISCGSLYEQIQSGKMTLSIL
jgi:hypothetical protein